MCGSYLGLPLATAKNTQEQRHRQSNTETRIPRFHEHPLFAHRHSAARSEAFGRPSTTVVSRYEDAAE